MQSKSLFILVLTCFFSIPNLIQAEIWLPSILSDGMVLQKNSQATIWGWTTASDETLKISGSWNNNIVEVKADVGHWSVKLPTPIAGGPYTIKIEGHETIVLNDVLIGEVWICGGQSNMEWTANSGIDNKEAEVSTANYPNIRFFKVPRRWSDFPQEDLPSHWEVCTPETMANFSAVGYFFGKELHKELDVPIGLISSNWGGTPVETWIPKEVLEDNPSLWEASKKINKSIWWPTEPGKAYNGMIFPLVNMELAGAIWYQGESNRINGDSYYESFPLLISSWRKMLRKEFPFLFVQLAPYKYDDKTQRDISVVRDAQWNTLKTVPNTGMAVTMDIGNVEDIHPKNKTAVGQRLALWALAKTYGRNLVFSGPEFKSVEFKGKKAVIQFDHIGSGLTSNEKDLTYFEIAGEDQKFYPATARIKDNKVEVWNNMVKKPFAVRYGFTNGAEPNLFNKEGLPAIPFRTDEWILQKD